MDRTRIVHFTHSKTTRFLTPSSSRRPANASSVSSSSSSLQAPLASIDTDIIPVTKRKPERKEAESRVLSNSFCGEDRQSERQDSVSGTNNETGQSEIPDDSSITPTDERRSDASCTVSFSSQTPARRNTADMTWLTSRRRLQKGPTVTLPPEYQTRARSQSMSCVTRRSHTESGHSFSSIQDNSSSESSSLYNEDSSDVVGLKQTFLTQPSLMKSTRSEISRTQSFRSQPISKYPSNAQTGPTQPPPTQSNHVESTRSFTLPTHLPHTKQFPLKSAVETSPVTHPPSMHAYKTSHEFATSPSNEVSPSPVCDIQDYQTSTKVLTTSHDSPGVRTSVTSNNRGYTKQTVITNVPPGFVLEPFHNNFSVSPSSNSWFLHKPSASLLKERDTNHSSESFQQMKDIPHGENSGQEEITTPTNAQSRMPDVITNPSADCVSPINEVCSSIDRKPSVSGKNTGPTSKPIKTFPEEQAQIPTTGPLLKVAVDYRMHAQTSEKQSNVNTTNYKAAYKAATRNTSIDNTNKTNEAVCDRLSCNDNETVRNSTQSENSGTSSMVDGNVNETASDFKPSWKRNSMRLALLGYTSMSDLTSSAEVLNLVPTEEGSNTSPETPSHGNASLVSKKEPRDALTDKPFSPKACSEKVRRDADIQESAQSHVNEILGDKERNSTVNPSLSPSLPPRSESGRKLIKRDSFRKATASTTDLSCAPDLLSNPSTSGLQGSSVMGVISGSPTSGEKNTTTNNSPGPLRTLNTPRRSEISLAGSATSDTVMRNSEILPPISSANNSKRDSLPSGQSSKQCLTVPTPVLTSSPVSERANMRSVDNGEKKVAHQIKRNSMRLATSSISDLTCVVDDLDFGDDSVVVTDSSTGSSLIMDMKQTGRHSPVKMDNTNANYDSSFNASASPDLNGSFGRKAGLDENRQRYMHSVKKTVPDWNESSYGQTTPDLNRSRTASLSSSRLNSSFGSFYSCQSLENFKARSSPLANARRKTQESTSKKANDSGDHSGRPTFLNLSETTEPSLADSSLVYYSAAETSFTEPEEGNKTSKRETLDQSQHYSQPTNVFYWTRPSPYTRPTQRTLHNNPSNSSKQSDHATRTTYVCRKDHFISNNNALSNFPSVRRPGEQFVYSNDRRPTRFLPKSELRLYSNSSEKEQLMYEHNVISSNLSVDSDRSRAIANNDVLSEDSLSETSFTEEDFSSPDNHRSPPSLGRPKRKQYAGFDSQPLPIDSFLSDSSSVYTGGVSCSSRALSTVGEVINPSDSFLDSGDSVTFGLEESLGYVDTGVSSLSMNTEQEEDNEEKYRDRVRQLCALTFNSVSKSRDVNGSDDNRDEVETPRDSRSNLIPLSGSDNTTEDEGKDTNSPPQDAPTGESGRGDGYKARAMKGASSAVVPRAKFQPRRKYFSSKDIMDLIRTSEKAGEGVATSLTSLERHANKVCRAILCCSSDLRAKGYTF